MAKNLYINRSQLEHVIKANYTLTKVDEVNPAQGFHKYHIEKEGAGFILDVYYTKKKRTTIIANCRNGQELEQAIINSIEYKEVRSGSFSALISEDVFDSLIKLLRMSPNVTLNSEDKGDNGLIYRIKTDFGDSVTLTYFKSTSRMLYQGHMMQLHSVIKSYLLTLDRTVTETEIGEGEQALEDRVQQQIKIYFPSGWDNLEPTIQGFIKDGFTLAEVNTKLSDYAAWVMPIMRVLEYRIKKICLDHNVFIDDTKGFKYYTGVEGYGPTDWIFEMDFSTDTVTGVNPNISNMPQDAKDTIVECYEFLRKNRHEMFHAQQILAGMRLVETSNEALRIITEACEIIEKSLVYNIRQVN